MLRYIKHQLIFLIFRIDAAIAASRDSSSSSQPQQPRSAPTSAKNTPVKELEVELTPKGSKKTTSHLQKLSAKPMEIKERVATDFFGRAIKVRVTIVRIFTYKLIRLTPLSC